MPTGARAFNYLDDCRRKATKPDGEILVCTLLPGSGLSARSVPPLDPSPPLKKGGLGGISPYCAQQPATITITHRGQRTCP